MLQLGIIIDIYIHECLDGSAQSAQLTYVKYNILPYSCVIKRMCIYFHSNKMCTYKRAMPNNEVQLN